MTLLPSMPLAPVTDLTLPLATRVAAAEARKPVRLGAWTEESRRSIGLPGGESAWYVAICDRRGRRARKPTNPRRISSAGPRKMHLYAPSLALGGSRYRDMMDLMRIESRRGNTPVGALV